MITALNRYSITNTPLYIPVRWASDRVRSVVERVFGYILRIVIFQLGEMKARGAYLIMRSYQRLASDPREEKPFDPARLRKSKDLLTRFGGVESVVDPTDNGSKIRCMTFKSTDFFNAFKEMGSSPVEVTYQGNKRKALLNPPPEAKGFYLPIDHVTLPDGTIQKGAILPEAPSFKDSPPIILHCHSPGRSMAMDRRFLGLHLAAGYDVSIWDPRGTVDSTGTPSEGGYYLDGEAVFNHLRSQGYQPDRIYVSGFCEGASVAAHLKKTFHHLGVHFIGSNMYTSIKAVIEGYGKIGRVAAQYGLKAIQNPNLKVKQDYFDNEEKFRNLGASQGKFVFIHTDTDTMMPSNTVPKLRDCIENAGPIFEILRRHPDQNANGHLQPPYEDPAVWRKYIEYVN